MLEFERRDDLPAGLDVLWATFGDVAYVRQKYRALGAASLQIRRFDVSATTITVELVRRVAVDRALLPPWSRRAVGEVQTLRHRSRWERVARERVVATLAIEPVGLPVRADGRGTIDEAAPARSTMLLHWRVSSPVPLLAARIEQAFAVHVRAALEADHAFTRRYLDDAAR